MGLTRWILAECQQLSWQYLPTIRSAKEICHRVRQRVFSVRLIHTQPVKKFSPFIKADGSLQCSEKPAFVPY